MKKLRTNTPMHALMTYNDVTYAEAARALAQEAMKAGPSDIERIRYAVQKVLARPPRPEELPIWQKALNRARAAYTQTPDQAKAFLDNGESKRDESLPATEHE